MKFPKYIEPDFTKEPFVSAPDVKTEKAGKNYLPINFYATTIYPEYFKINGEWKMIKESRMDSVIVIKNGEPIVTEPRRVKEGDEVVVGRHDDGSTGVYVNADWMKNTTLLLHSEQVSQEKHHSHASMTIFTIF